MAGTVAAAGTTSPFGLMLAVIIGAIVGNTQAYSFGRWFGQKIYTKNFLFLKQDKLMRAKVFYDKHGGKTVFLGRFVPIIRAFVPIIAGAASMKSLRFEFYSMTGAVAWAVGLIGAGYLFGNIPIVRNNLRPHHHRLDPPDAACEGCPKGSPGHAAEGLRPKGLSSPHPEIRKRS